MLTIFTAAKHLHDAHVIFKLITSTELHIRYKPTVCTPYYIVVTQYIELYNFFAARQHDTYSLTHHIHTRTHALAHNTVWAWYKTRTQLTTARALLYGLGFLLELRVAEYVLLGVNEGDLRLSRECVDDALFVGVFVAVRDLVALLEPDLLRVLV